MPIHLQLRIATQAAGRLLLGEILGVAKLDFLEVRLS
jgi:hypothetical protein